MTIRQSKIAAAVLIGILALGLRLKGLGSFMTADESNWMVRSATFWHEIFRDRDWSGTFLTTHPGATTMWIAGAGAMIQEQRLGFDVDTSNLQFFRKAMTYPIAMTAAVLIGIIAWLLMGLFGGGAGLIMGVLLALDPFLLGLSQVVHLDALLSLLMLLSLLLYFQYIHRQRAGWALAAGITAGLALAEKMALAAWLLPVTALMTAAAMWGNEGGRKRIISVWLTAAVLSLATLAVTWPAIISRADLQMGYITKDVAMVIADEHVALSLGDQPINPMTFYGRTVLARTMPLVLIGSLGAAMAVLIFARRQKDAAKIRWLLFYAIGYIVLISFAAKKGDRYALPGLIVLPLITGWGLWTAAERVRVLSRRIKSKEAARKVRGFAYGALAAAIGGAAAVTISWLPHALAYNNSWFEVRPLSQQGWGEGLELAALWLNQHPLGSRLTVASWYPDALATYFSGKTFSLSARNDYRVGYIVTYRNMGGRERDSIASDVLEEVKKQQPAKIISIHGRPYAWIYETMSVGYFTKHIGSLKSGLEAGQTVMPETEKWDRIAIGFATFSGRNNTKDVILHVKENPQAAVDLRTVTVNAKDIVDNEWHLFRFAPIEEARGKTFFVSLTSPDSTETNAVTVRYVDENILPGEMWLKRPGSGGAPGRLTVKPDADLAYKLPK